MVDRKSRRARDEKIENLMMNQSIMYMGLFEDGLAAVAERITQPSASARADLGKKETGVIAPEVLAQIGQILSGMREETASQMPKKANVFARHISDPAFDKGIEIVEKHDFRRPMITEKLTDEVLASYIFLLQSGDKELAKMFQELREWQTGLPKSPWDHPYSHAPLK